MLAVLQDWGAVYDYVVHAGGVLMGVGEGGFVANCFWIEDDYIGLVAFFELTSVCDIEILGGERGEFSDGFLEGDDIFFTDVFTEDSRKIAVGSGVLGEVEEDAFGCWCACV